MQKLKKILRRWENLIASGIFVATLVVLLSGVVRPGFTCVTGDMRARYEARIPVELEETYLDAERMNVGLGAAAVGGWDGLGDALAIGGRVFVRHTHRASPRYYHLVVNRYFQSNAFVYVPTQRRADTHYRIAADTRMDQILDELAQAYPEGVIAAGAVRLTPFRSIAMSAPAITGEPITQRAVRYYTRPLEAAVESWAYVVLVAARNDDAQLAALLPPPAGRTIPAGQALALRLASAPSTLDPATLAHNAVSVGQLLKDAVVAQGELALYPIAHAQRCVPAANVTSLPPR